MAIRATDAAVNVWMNTTLLVYTTFITAANLIVEEDLVGEGLTEARLTQIENLLAAHFATLANEKGGIVRTSAGESAETYRSVKEAYQGLTSTRFGQMAIAMDTTGTLVNQMSGGKKAEFRVV